MTFEKGGGGGGTNKTAGEQPKETKTKVAKNNQRHKEKNYRRKEGESKSSRYQGNEVGWKEGSSQSLLEGICQFFNEFEVKRGGLRSELIRFV